VPTTAKPPRDQHDNAKARDRDCGEPPGHAHRDTAGDPRNERRGTTAHDRTDHHSRSEAFLRIDDGFELLGGRRPGRTGRGSVHAAGKPEWLVTRCERILAVNQDRRRAPEPGGLRLFGGRDEAMLHLQTAASGDVPEPLIGDLPVRAVIEVQQLDLQGVPSDASRCVLRVTVNPPVQWKVKEVVGMRIGELAAHSGVNDKTIRFWESAGVLANPVRTPSGYRDYDPDVVDRLRFIRHAQTAGLTLAEIRQILTISDNGETPCGHVTDLIHQHLADVDHRIYELTETRRLLRRMARRAADQDPADCNGYCAILQPPGSQRRTTPAVGHPSSPGR